jgi:hypothetical protein
MEPMAVYLLKSGALIALFYLAYLLLLRKETFFNGNRWYLLSGLITAVVLPLVTYTKVIWIDPAPRAINWTAIPLDTVIVRPQPETFEINWILMLGIVYTIGILAFVLSFVLDFWSLNKALKGKTVYQQADFRFVDTDEKVSPFSYFNYIVYNSSLYSDAELANIIEHEKVHSNQNHTIDVLVARLFCIVFWFNPFIWLYKKAMLQNLEFIADNEAVKNMEDRKSYQITLLKVTAHENCVEITNHFYQSLIKKRIVMLNKNQSKKSNSWKYALILPALAAFMFYFQVKVIAQEKEIPPIAQQLPVQGAEVVVDKNTSDAQLKAEAERVKKEHGVTLKFSKVKRNSSGEIVAIKATFKDENGKKGVTQVSGDEPIAPIRFYKNDDGLIGFGNGHGRNMRVIRLNEHDMEPGSFTFSFDDDDDITIDAPDAPEPPEMPDGVDPPAVPGAPDAPAPPKGCNDKQIIIKRGANGEHPKVIVNGEVVADVDKVLSEIGPIIINGEDVLKNGSTYSYTKSGDGSAIVIDTRKITARSMNDAQEAMKRVRPEIERARRDAERSRELSKPEMEEARRQMEQARDEMKQAKLELEKVRADLEKEKANKK